MLLKYDEPAHPGLRRRFSQARRTLRIGFLVQIRVGGSIVKNMCACREMNDQIHPVESLSPVGGRTDIADQRPLRDSGGGRRMIDAQRRTHDIAGLPQSIAETRPTKPVTPVTNRRVMIDRPRTERGARQLIRFIGASPFDRAP